MKLPKSDKAEILKAYFEKIITKVQMEFLLKHGKAIAPIVWVYSNEEEEEEKIQEQKREWKSRVFGISYPKIEWV